MKLQIKLSIAVGMSLILMLLMGSETLAQGKINVGSLILEL